MTQKHSEQEIKDRLVKAEEKFQERKQKRQEDKERKKFIRSYFEDNHIQLLYWDVGLGWSVAFSLQTDNGGIVDISFTIKSPKDNFSRPNARSNLYDLVTKDDFKLTTPLVGVTRSDPVPLHIVCSYVNIMLVKMAFLSLVLERLGGDSERTVGISKKFAQHIRDFYLPNCSNFH